MNPYYQNWSYGYTLAPATEQSRGAYTTAAAYGHGQAGPNQSNLAAIGSNAAHGGAQSWQDIKSEYASQLAQPPLPQGPHKTQQFVTSSSTTLKSEMENNMIGPIRPGQAAPSTQIDPNKALSKLHELAISNKLVERFEKVCEPEAGNPSKTEFIYKLFIGTETYEGKGNNLKIAKQNAALQALANTKYQTSKEKKLTMFNTAKRIGVTATSELHEIAAKKGVHVDFKFLEPYNFEFKHSMRMWSKKEMLGNYRVQLNVAGYEFYGQAELPQQAKHNASTQALEIVRKIPDPSSAGKVVARPGGVKPEPDEGEEAPVVQPGGKNVTMYLNEIAISNSCTPEWILLSETGPPHARVYTWQLKIGEFVTHGSGPNKKLAKQGAADLMLATLPDEWKAKVRGRARSNNQRYNSQNKRKGGKNGPPAKRMAGGGVEEKLVITANNPVSCLHEYAKKKKIPDPSFTVLAETVIENIQKVNHSFKKIEYSMQLHIDGRVYGASALNKKAAKQSCAMEAWDEIQRTL